MNMAYREFSPTALAFAQTHSNDPGVILTRNADDLMQVGFASGEFVKAAICTLPRGKCFVHGRPTDCNGRVVITKSIRRWGLRA